MITRDDITRLRAQACGLVAVLGPILDSLQTIDETLTNPHQLDVDASIIAQHLDSTAEGLDELQQLAAELAEDQARHRRNTRQLADSMVQLLTKGGA